MSSYKQFHHNTQDEEQLPDVDDLEVAYLSAQSAMEAIEQLQVINKHVANQNADVKETEQDGKSSEEESSAYESSVYEGTLYQSSVYEVQSEKESDINQVVIPQHQTDIVRPLFIPQQSTLDFNVEAHKSIQTESTQYESSEYESNFSKEKITQTNKIQNQQLELSGLQKLKNIINLSNSQSSDSIMEPKNDQLTKQKKSKIMQNQSKLQYQEQMYQENRIQDDLVNPVSIFIDILHNNQIEYCQISFKCLSQYKAQQEQAQVYIKRQLKGKSKRIKPQRNDIQLKGEYKLVLDKLPKWIYQSDSDSEVMQNTSDQINKYKINGINDQNKLLELSDGESDMQSLSSLKVRRGKADPSANVIDADFLGQTDDQILITFANKDINWLKIDDELLSWVGRRKFLNDNGQLRSDKIKFLPSAVNLTNQNFKDTFFEIGTITQVIKDMILLSAPVGVQQDIAEGSIVVTLDKEVIVGLVIEVFGPIQKPFYAIRHLSAFMQQQQQIVEQENSTDNTWNDVQQNTQIEQKYKVSSLQDMKQGQVLYVPKSYASRMPEQLYQSNLSKSHVQFQDDSDNSLSDNNISGSEELFSDDEKESLFLKKKRNSFNKVQQKSQSIVKNYQNQKQKKILNKKSNRTQNQWPPNLDEILSQNISNIYKRDIYGQQDQIAQQEISKEQYNKKQRFEDQQSKNQQSNKRQKYGIFKRNKTNGKDNQRQSKSLQPLIKSYQIQEPSCQFKRPQYQLSLKSNQNTNQPVKSGVTQQIKKPVIHVQAPQNKLNVIDNTINFANQQQSQHKQFIVGEQQQLPPQLQQSQLQMGSIKPQLSYNQGNSYIYLAQNNIKQNLNVGQQQNTGQFNYRPNFNRQLVNGYTLSLKPNLQNQQNQQTQYAQPRVVHPQQVQLVANPQDYIQNQIYQQINKNSQVPQAQWRGLHNQN